VTGSPEQVDYFQNHRLKLRFPWSLYHRPIVSALEAAFGEALGPEVLNVGSHTSLTWTASDNTSVKNVDLDLSRTGSGGPFESIAAGTANTGSFRSTTATASL